MMREFTIAAIVLGLFSAALYAAPGDAHSWFVAPLYPMVLCIIAAASARFWRFPR